MWSVFLFFMVMRFFVFMGSFFMVMRFFVFMGSCWFCWSAHWKIFFIFWNWARNFALWFISMDFISLMMGNLSFASFVLVMDNGTGSFLIGRFGYSSDVSLVLFNFISMVNKFCLFSSGVSGGFGFTLGAMSTSFGMFGNNNLFMSSFRIFWFVRFQSFIL